MRVDRSHCDASVDKDVNGATKILDDDLEKGATSYTNPDKITVPDGGEVTAVFYLQHNQFVTIMGVPKGSDYEVSEDDYSSEGYTKISAETEPFTIKTGTAENDKVEFKDKLKDEIGDADAYTGFTNDKHGTIPTGVILSVAGLLIVGIFSIIGFVFFGIRSKRRYEED